MPATTIAEAFNAVNPDEPLEAGSPYYVDLNPWRGDQPVAERIAQQIRLSDGTKHVKQLFAGHRGCGKSSELLRLKAMLEDDGFLVAYLDSTFAIDISDVSYTDVLIAAMLAVAEAARERGLTVPTGTVEGLRRRLGELTTEENVALEAATEATAQAEVGGGLPGLLKLVLGLKSTLKASADRKQKLRYTIDQGITLFLEDLNDIVNTLQTQLHDAGQKGLVLIVDSLDRILPNPKPDGSTTHTDIFVDHAYHLRAPRCHVVYTVPISIYFNSNLLPLYASQPLALPMVKVAHQDDTPCEEALGALEEAVRRRIDVEALFDEPADVRRLCRESGGHVRDLMHLLTEACLRSGNGRISPEVVDRSVQALVTQYDRLIQKSYLDRLAEIHRERQLFPGDALLAYHLLVLEYMNGEAWAEVHPAVRRTRKFRDALQADAVRESPAP